MKRLILFFLFATLLNFSYSQCNYQFCMEDTWGDGWNGNSIDVFVNGVLIYNDYSLPSGSGPLCYNLAVVTGDDVDIIFNPTGSFITECEFFLYNSSGTQVGFGNSAANINNVIVDCSGGGPGPGTINTCSGNFYDTGGAAGIYSASEDYTVTYCPDVPGSMISFNFTMFNVEDGFDYITVYDGNSTAAPSMGTYDNGLPLLGTVQATPGNPTGCLTFVFHSDGSVQYAGWAAAISCTNPCQQVNSVWDGSNPGGAIDPGDGAYYIDICQGETVTFNAHGSYPQNGTSYVQSDATSTFYWQFGDGANATGTSVSHTYPNGGGYDVDLTITDINGCQNANDLGVRVRVSTDPVFAGTSADDPTICVGQCTDLNGVVTPTPWVQPTGATLAGTTFLPDGSGVSYETDLCFNTFTPGQTVTSVNDIIEICLNMEHSYLGDLSFYIECPNGQTMDILDYANNTGGGTILGNPVAVGLPVDDNTADLTPGVGLDYCFTPTSVNGFIYNAANWTTIAPYTDPIGNVSATANQVNAGDYQADGAWTNLIGCPLNGCWTIHITDHLGADNGYIFSWGIYFDPSLYPALWGFTPTIVTGSWTGNGVGPGNPATACPSGSGIQNYTYTVTDNFGCTYDTTISINVTQLTITTSFTNATCQGVNNGTASVTSVVGGTNPITYTWSPNVSGTNNATGLGPGTYNVTVTDNIGCQAYHTFVITAPPAMTLSTSSVPENCGACDGTATVNVTVGGTGPFSYLWNDPAPAQTIQTATALCAGNYTVTVTDANGCTATANVTVAGTGTVNGGFTYNGNQCLNGNSFNFTNTGDSGPGFTYFWTFAGGSPATSASQNPSGITWAAPGTYAVTQTTTSGSCNDVTTINITVFPQPTGTFTNTNVTCNGLCNGQSTVTPASGNPPYTYLWNDPAPAQTTQTATALCAGNYTVTISDANGCTGTASTTITQPNPIVLNTTRTNVLCFGQCTGSATVNVTSGGTPGFTYNWAAGASPNAATTTGLCAGTYTVTVTDANGCTATASVTITQPPSALSLTISGVNPLCNGVCNGSATVVASGGTAGYSYSWSGGGGTNATASNLCAGNYTVTVTDANGCTATQNITLTNPPVLTVSVTGTNVTCNGVCNGSVAANPSGGTPAYTYAWSNGAGTGSSASGLCANTYTVTVTDANGCTATGSYTVTQNPAVTANITASTNVTCNGLCNGTATVTAGGGTGTYTYLWNDPAPAQTTVTATALCAGNYTVTVTDGNGCTATANVTITQNPAVTANITASTNVTCNGLCNGTATVTAGGGTGAYTYLWNDPAPAQTTVTATALCAGSYTVTVTDGNGCTATANVTITQNPAVTANITASTNVTCNGLCNGSATVAGGGGTGAGTYSYLWNDPAPAQTTATATALCAGNYTVTVTDGNGCTATTNVTITQNPAVTANITASTNVSCNGACDGTATVTAGGGTGTYTYLWNDPAPAQTTVTATALCAGNYTVTVTDGNGCTATANVTITQNPAVTANITASTNVSCNGACDGTATVTAGGGTGTYTYLWNDPAPAQTTITATALCAGSYTVTVTDGNGCTATANVTITQNPAVTANITASTNVSCNGLCNGSATVTAGGGTGVGTYTYLWNDPAPAQTTATATALCAGSYTVTVTDGNGCTATTNVTITENPALTVTVTGNNASCNGVCDGDATATPAGGTGTYSYDWDDPLFSSTATINSLCAGIYNVTITDGNGCTTTGSFTVTEPAAMVLTPSTIDATCGSSNGTASVSVAGGTPGYNYDWSPNGFTGDGTDTYTNVPSGTYTVTVTDVNGCTEDISISVNDAGSPVVVISASTNVSCNGLCDGTATATITTTSSAPYDYVWSNGSSTMNTANLSDNVSALCAGPITVTVTDNVGCAATASVTITQNPVLNASITSSTDVSCNGVCDGAATVSVSGGTGAGTYTYSWSGGAGATASVSGLCAGNYTVTVTDGNGCTDDATVTINENPPVTASITGTNDVSCNGLCDGDATVLAGGGTGSYTYDWGGGNLTATATGLCAGNYTVTVTDSDGCTATANATINQNPAVTATITGSNDVSCNGLCDGDATVLAGGGTGTYTYLWNDPAPAQTTITASALCAGSYTVTVTDGNGCTAAANVTINENPSVTATITGSNDVSCNGLCDGDATVLAGGGTGAYTYLWNDPAPAQTTITASALCAGSYTVTVTDGNACTATASVTINENPAVTASATGVDVVCNGDCDGSATVIPGGGTGAGTYSYNWTGGMTTETVNNLCAGSYDVTVTDADGCTATASVTINENAPVTATITGSNDVSVFGACDGDATVAGGGGTGTYTYNWSGGGGTNTTASGLCAGTYTVTVTDGNGCTDVATVVINEPNAIIITVDATVNVTCFGDCDGSAQLSVSGGVPPYTYLWNDPSNQTVEDPVNLCAGTFTVTVTDFNGATATQSITINQNPAVTAVIAGTTDVSCNGGCNGTATVTPGGGTGIYSYLWSDPVGQTTLTANGLCAGSYTVTVTDNNGCTQTAVATINEPTLLTAAITLSSDVSCNGLCDGSATVAGSDGTPGYTYLWSDPGAQTTQTASGLCIGTFTVTVTDANLCTATTTVTINQPPLLTASTSVTDAHCGLTDGDATVTPGGGTGAGTYTFEWSDPMSQITPTATGLGAGSYTVTVTDGNGCTVTAVAIVGDLSGVTASITGQVNVSCNGVCDGEATVAGAGGNAPYTYLWSDPLAQTTPTATGLCAGTYNVTVFDFDGCQSVTSAAITEPNILTAAIDAFTDASCNGGSDGTASVLAADGTAPYSYLWDGGAAPTSSLNSGLMAGTYNVTVTDNNGCTATTSVVISEPTALVLTFGGVDENCNQANGYAYVSATGGTTALDYIYNWSGGTNPANDTITGIGAGTYNVTVTDDNSCTATGSYIVSNIPPGIASISSFVDVSCNGLCDGSATASMGGGNPPVTYLWDDPLAQTTITATGLCPGTYTISITDADNCVVTATAVISEPNALSLAIATTDIVCYGDCNGDATANVTDGTAPYTYQWDDPLLSVTPGIANLCPGTYCVTVTDDNGCTITDCRTFTDPPQMTIAGTVSPASCAQADGGIDITVSNGAPVSFLWSPNGAVTEDLTNIAAGTYTVTATDIRGCTATGTFIVPDLSGPTATISASVNVTCNGDCDGTATVSVTGGAIPYTYDWDDPAHQTAATATNLCAGNYIVTVTDQNGCISTANLTITEPAILQISSIFTTDPLCYNDCDGTARVVAVGGTQPYTYLWTGGNPTGGLNPNDSLTTGLCNGIFTVIVTDGHGCTVSGNATITEPTFMALSITGNDVSCFGLSDGDATVTAAGGTPGYLYQWDAAAGSQTTPTAFNIGAGTFCVTVTDMNACTEDICVTIDSPAQIVAQINNFGNINCFGNATGFAIVDASGGTPGYTYLWNTFQTTQTINNLTAGNYTVIVTDANSCTTSANVTLTQPPALNLTLVATDESCYNYCDGNIEAIISGGVTPYNILWSDFQTTAIADSLCPGIYTVNITDANGCMISGNDVVAGPPLLAAVTNNVVNANCGQPDGSASVIINGGTNPYGYAWYNGSGTLLSQTLSLTNVTSGAYYFTVTDANGCQAGVTVNINDLSGPVIDSIIVVNVDCHGNANGMGIAYVSGGTSPYTYLWNDPMHQVTSTATGLSGGNYTIVVTDNNGCVTNANISVFEPPTLNSAINSFTNVTCYGGNNGNAMVQAGGGVPPYTYVWNPTGQITQTATGLFAGNYTVIVSDANGCTDMSNATISQPTQLIVTETITNASCNGTCDGVISLVTSGGTQPANFTWMAPASGSNSVVANLCAGIYTVIVSDVNGCDQTLNYTVDEPLPIDIYTSVISATCGDDNGAAMIDSITGGTSPFTYNWSPGNYSSQVVYNLGSGSYVLQVEDFNGCTSTTNVSVGNIPGPVLLSFVSTDVSCFGGSDGEITVGVNGGTVPYSYMWSNGNPTQTAVGLTAGQYSVTVTDVNGCTLASTSYVDEPSQIQLVTSGPTEPLCIGQYANITANATGGTPPYSFVWSDPNITDSLSSQMVYPTVTTSYQVYAIDANGCVSYPPMNILVSVYPAITVSISPDMNICEGESASVYASASGGNGGPYTYLWNYGSGNPNVVTPYSDVTLSVSAKDGCTSPSDTASMTIYVHPAPHLAVQPIGISGCEPLVVIFDNALQPTSEHVNYLWNFGDVSSGAYNSSTDSVPMHLFESNGFYDVMLTISNDYGCSTEYTFYELIKVYDVPDAEFYASPEVVKMFNPDIQFFDQSLSDDPITAWQWDFDDGNYATVQNPEHSYGTVGEFEVQLVIMTGAGCTDTVVHIVKVLEEHTFYAPTAFSPNSGLQNNYFYPKGIGINPDKYYLVIYDRWGEILFESDIYPDGTDKRNEVAGGWNGRYMNTGDIVKLGTYTWYVRLTDVNGQQHEYVGAVTVIR